MTCYPPTIVVRHRRENLKKCSLKGLEKREDFLFFCYPLVLTPPYASYTLLSLDATIELSENDEPSGILLIDGTWRLAEKMLKNIPLREQLVKRCLPKNILTAYPRRQHDCIHPQQGLASIEALYAAYLIMGRPTTGLLDHYHWKDSFLEKNKRVLI